MSHYPVKYSIVVPVYNSTESLRLLLDRIENIFNSVIGSSWEVILIDDASPKEETWKVLEELTQKKMYVRSFQLTRNFGKNAALLCGFEYAIGEYIITMDDDLQHRPEDIPLLIKEERHDIVIGCFKSKKHSIIKQAFSKVNSWFETKLIDKPSHIRSSPFRLINKSVVDGMLKIKTAYPSLSAQMYYVSRDVVNVYVTHDERKDEPSGFTLNKMLAVFSNLLINNSSFLLKLIATVGVIISVISIGLAFFYVVKKVTVGTTVPGWASLMVAILFIGGLILFSIGLVGEYLIRIINGVERKPTYVIRKKRE